MAGGRTGARSLILLSLGAIAVAGWIALSRWSDRSQRSPTIFQLPVPAFLVPAKLERHDDISALSISALLNISPLAFAPSLQAPAAGPRGLATLVT